MASADSTGQTPDSLDTSSDTTPPGDNLFDQITGNVVTLAGAFGVLPRANNSPVQNTIPSNTPSSVPTAPANKVAFYAGWSTTQKIGAAAAGVVAIILGLFGLRAFFSKKG
jgi:hypothetical protein